jgi:negative regulator of flagellin synthesis FlgM
MKISHKGPANPELSKLLKNDRSVPASGRDGDSKVQSSESTRISISKEARKLQRVAELARTADELRAEKVNRIKQQITEGRYQVKPEEVARSIAQGEISRLLEKK